MSVLKDLTCTKGNEAVDIARVTTLASALLYWGCVFYEMVYRNSFDPVQVGLGAAALQGTGAAWISLRQKYEQAPQENAQ